MLKQVNHKSYLTKRSIAVFFAFCLILYTNSYAYMGNIGLVTSVTVRQSFDDNITSVQDNKINDFITNLSLGLDMEYEGKAQTLRLKGALSQELFLEETDFNNFSQNISLNFQKEFSKYDRFNLSNSFIHAEEPQSFQDEFGRTSGRYSYCLNRFNLGYSRDISKQLSLSLKYANEFYKPSGEDLLDSSLHSIGLQADYFFSSRTIFPFLYEFFYRDFDSGQSSSIHSLAAGIRQYLTRQLYIDARAGLNFIDSFNNQDYTKINLLAALTNEVNETTRNTLTFSKEYNTNYSTEDIFDSWRLTLSFIKQLLERLTCSVSVFYGKGEYVSSNIKDEFKGGNTRLAYDLNKDSQIFLMYSYSNNSSNNNTRGYDRNIISIGLRHNF